MKRKAAVPITSGFFALLLALGLFANAAAQRDGGTAASAATAVSDNGQLIDENVFPKDKVVDVKITLDEDDFQNMLDNASAEEYKTASVNYNGIQMDNIGIRTKGNLSLRSVVNMEDSDRYSFKLSFDEYVGQTMYGISKINLNNNYSDATYMREFLTYELADLMGLATPKFSFVNLYVNDELRGLYFAVEQVGDSYLERHFGNSDGSLYKGVMTGSGSDLQWIDDDAGSYTGLAARSEKTDEDNLIAMLDELNNGTDLERYIDIDDALGYIALNVLTVNTDSYLGSNKQNYYLYDNDGVFSMLPWDYNMAFGGLSGGSLKIDEPTQGALAERPLIAKLLAVDEYKEKYHALIQEALDGYLANDAFSERVKQISEMISSFVEQDPTAFFTYEQYEQGVQSLISTNAKTVAAYQSQLDGTTAISGDGSGSGGGFGGGMRGGGFGGGGFGGAGQGLGADGQNDDAQEQQLPDNGAPTGETAPDEQAQDGAGLTGSVKNAPSGMSAASYRAGGESAVITAAAQGDAAQDGAARGSADGDAGDAAAQDGAAQGGAAQGGAGDDAAQGGAAPGGMQPPDAGGGMGMGGGPGGGQFQGGGMGGGPGGFGQNDQAVAQQGSVKTAVTTGISLIVLLLACVFVVLFKRKRW